MRKEMTDRERAIAIAKAVPQDEKEMVMWAGSGWPDSLVKAFGLDIPENERGVWWPLAYAEEGKFVVFCNDEKLQARIAGALMSAPILAKALLEEIGESGKETD